MQWLPDRVDSEPGALTGVTMASLRTDGYALHEVPFWGSAQAIVRNSSSGLLEGDTDRRAPAGAALGY